MAVFIDLWPCLPVTRLRQALLFKRGHTIMCIRVKVGDESVLNKIMTVCKVVQIFLVKSQIN